MVMMNLLLAFLIFFSSVSAYQNEWEQGGGGGRERRFLMDSSEQLVKTDGGEVHVARGRHMHIGFISMEPSTLLIPQYADADLVLFVRRGDAKLGFIHKDKMAEQQLKMGDVNRVPAGSAFYIVNTGKGQRLHIICSIIPTSDYGWDRTQPAFQSFLLGGGFHPKSVLAGFDIRVRTAAFNSTIDEVSAITEGYNVDGVIIYVNDTAVEPSSHRLLKYYSNIVMEPKKMEQEEEEDDQPEPWALRRFFSFILGYDRDQAVGNKKKSGPVRAPDSYNLYGREPDYRNSYGWTLALDERDYHPLTHSDIGIFLVKITAGSMLAPHFNPRAAEYCYVLSGEGVVQVVYPNGTLAMSAEVREGDMFWVPKYFPFCQIAARGGPLELFGFTTSALDNHPQFLAGESSVLREMMGEELAAGMGVSRKVLERFLRAQNESVLLPTWPRPEEEEEKRREEEKEKKKKGKGE